MWFLPDSLADVVFVLPDSLVHVAFLPDSLEDVVFDFPIAMSVRLRQTLCRKRGCLNASS